VETVKSLNGHLTVRKYIDIPSVVGGINGGWRKWYTEELYNLYASVNIQ